MGIPVTKLSFTLDTDKPNITLDQRFLQGNQDKEWHIRISKDGVEQTITDGIKPKITFVYYQGLTNRIKGTFVYSETTSNPAYNVTVANNVVTVPPNVLMTDSAGKVQVILEITDSGTFYTYSFMYNVDENKAYQPQEFINNLPTMGNYALKDLSNVDDKVFDSKVGALPSLTNLAKTDLSNVDDSDLLKKGAGAGLLQQDLEDVDLAKLHEKCGAAKIAYDDLANVDENDINRKILLSNAYKTIESKMPSHAGIKARYIEETGPIDFSTIAEPVIHAVYQITQENEVIHQTLPPSNVDKVIIIEIAYSRGINKGSVEITPAQGETFFGTITPTLLTDNGIKGVALSEIGGWDWIPIEVAHPFAFSVSDGTNVEVGVNSIEFSGATVSGLGGETALVTINNTGGGSGTPATQFEDITGNKFTPNLVKSLLKDVEIHKIDNKDGTFTANLNIAPSLLKEHHNEGIHVFLGNDEIINSKYGKSKLYFGDTRVKGGMFVYPDMNTKSFVLQDIDPQDDPNISGGTTFIIALYYEPDMDFENTITQDGSIDLELVDDNDNVLIDINGNPMGARIDYKNGDLVKPELYIGECQIKAFTRVHLKIKGNFANEELLSVGANTQLCIQATSKEETSGLALLSFMAYTGYKINFDSRYYGYNSLNLASRLIFNIPEDNTGTTDINLGQNLYLNFKSNMKLSINNYHLIIKDDGSTIPVWSMTKYYDKLDSKYISGKNYKVTATITNKDNAYRVGMLEYTGTTNQAPVPKVESYNNGNPVFTADWRLVDTLFIAENPSQEDYTATKIFTVPDNSKGIAIIMYAEVPEVPSVLQLKDLEGDITPWFNKIIITDSSNIKEQYLQLLDNKYKSVVYTPSGYNVYRYTVNSTDTKIPAGVISGGDGKVTNDNSWHDSGSIDPLKTQGDFKFLVDGTVKIKYTAKLYNETNSMNNIEFWLAKVDGNNLVEVPNSKHATTIEAHRNIPKIITSSEFTFDVKANETYRMLAKSNIDDGFYLQSETNGVPLFQTDIDFKEFTQMDKDILEQTNEVKFMENGKEVYNKILEYDVGTGKMRVIDK